MAGRRAAASAALVRLDPASDLREPIRALHSESVTGQPIGAQHSAGTLWSLSWLVNDNKSRLPGSQ